MTIRHRIASLIFLPVAASGFSTAQSGITAPKIETIVERMAQARADNRAHFRAYRVTRDYRLFGKERQKPKFEVTAAVSFVPPDSKTYVIQSIKGLGLGVKIVRQLLDGEANIAKNYSSTEISPANYDLRLIGEEYVGSRRCHLLELLPKRNDQRLLNGRIWVDASTYLLQRMEGTPAKSPSFWLRNPSIKFLYGDVGGMWLQTSSESTANVRMLGQFTMITRDLGYQPENKLDRSMTATSASAIDGQMSRSDRRER